jgi:hypothetical protein
VKLELANNYGKFFDFLDLIETERPIYSIDSFNGIKISEDLFCEVCKIQYIGWKHRILYKRDIKSSISDVFQDIIAYFLKAALPKNYEVLLENKIGKIRPDILIKKNKEYHFAIEVKTTVGWGGRIDSRDKETIKPYEKRVNSIKKIINIAKENIIYIFAGVRNNGHGFLEQFWNEQTRERKPRPSQFPYSNIYPLFDQYDPYYWDWSKSGIKRDEEYAVLDDKEFYEKAQTKIIVTPFEEILEKIIK